MHLNKNLKRVMVVILVCFLVLSTSLISVSADTSVLDEARSIIKQYYVDEVPDSTLNLSTIQDIIKGLNDPYTSYFTTQEYKDFINSVNMNFVGIGVQVEVVPEGIKINSIFDGSPALEAGIKVNDIITKAGDQSLSGLSSEQAVSYVKGEEGTTVHLTIKRGAEIIEKDVQRRQIQIPTVSSKLIDKHIGYIEIQSFGDDTGDKFYEAYKKLNTEKADSYVIDLRGNPGGYLNTALDIGGYLFGKKVVIKTKDRIDGDGAMYATAHNTIIDKPIIFLTDGGSASASEALTGAVKDNKRAFILGDKTFGKGCMQSMFSLSDGSVLKLTVANFYTPNGTKIHKVGIQPDINVGSDDALLAGRLLFTKVSDPVNKTGYIHIVQNGYKFNIDLSKARDKEFWGAYKKIINKVSSVKNVFVGNKNKWVSAPANFKSKQWELYYPGYKEGKAFLNVSDNKRFDIAFNKNINIKSLTSKSVELINNTTGDRTNLSIAKKGSNGIEIVPKSKLKKGQDYYLVVNGGIKDIKGNLVNSQVVSKVTVAK